MNVIVTIRNGQRSREEYSNLYEFVRKVEELSAIGTVLFYDRNSIGGASAIIEV